MALLRLAASLYVAVLTCLLGWVGVGVVLGWQPLVVTSPPAIHHLDRGDVVFVTPLPIEPANAVVAAVDLGGQRTIRRVHSLGPGGLVATADGRPPHSGAIVTEAELVGVAQMTVPVVGLPFALWAEGQVEALSAVLLVSVVAVGSVLFELGSGLSRRRSERESSGRWPLVAGADFIGRRLHVALALALAADYALDPGTIAIGGRALDRGWLVAIGTLALVVVGTGPAAGWLMARRPTATRLAALITTMVVAALGASTGSSGLSWLLVLLPLAQAAVIFGLSATAATWVVLLGLVLLGRAALLPDATAALERDSLDLIIARAGLVLLVVLPAAYWVERLGLEARAGRRLLQATRQRGRQLETLAGTGRDLSAVRPVPLEAIIDRTIAIGFDSADIVESVNGVDWVETAARGDRRMPPPGGSGSGLRRRDGTSPITVVDWRQCESDERDALVSGGLGLLVASPLSKRLGRIVVLRAGTDLERPITDDQVELFTLLSGQVALAARNEDLIGELQAVRDRQHLFAGQDSLTGLASYDGLVQDLAIELLDEDAAPVVIVWAPNDFEEAYELLGHERSTALLQIAAHRIRRLAGAHCSAARTWSQEFAVMIPGAPGEDVIADVIRRIEQVAEEPFEVGGELVRLSTTIGLAVGRPGTDPSEVVRQAQIARQEPQVDGSNELRHRRYHPDFDRHRDRRSALGQALPAVIASGEIGDGDLTLQYQPIRRLSGRDPIVGFEANVRWHHGLHGEVPAGEILELAHSMGRGDDLYRFIIDRVAGDASRWAADYPGLPFFVLLKVPSSVHIATGLVGRVRFALELASLDPAHLVLEFGEQRERHEEMWSNVTTLAELGVGVFLGGSLSGRTTPLEAAGVPLSGVKLDGDFFERASSSEAERIVAETTVRRYRDLNLVVMAEGIDSDDALDSVTRLGCVFGQGRRLDGPADPTDVRTMLANEYSQLSSVLLHPTAGDNGRPG